MALPRRSRSFTRARKKRTVWENLSLIHTHAPAASQVITDISPEPMATDLVGSAKILRCVGHLTFSLSAVSGTLVQVAGFGISVVTNDAFAALAVPDPISGDFQQGYYYWTSFGFNVTDGEGPNWQDMPFDVRTQRVLRSGYKLVMSSETPLQDQTTTVFISMRNLWEID